MATYDRAASIRQRESLPEPQTTGFVCPICREALDLEISLHAWEVAGSNNRFGHLYHHTLLPRGLVFGRFQVFTDGTFLIEPMPNYLPVSQVQASYTPMHSRCYKAKRQEWVAINQASCTHEVRSLGASICPDCRKRLW